MVTAILLLNTARDKINNVAEALVNMDGVSEVHSVAGRFDLVGIVRVPDNRHLADLVTNSIRPLEGIERSETLIGFRVHSHHDLERLFSIGLEEEAQPST